MRGSADGSGQPEIKINDRLLIRLHRDSDKLDEVVGYDEFGNCEFHLEQMDDFQWWMRWYSTQGRSLPQELIVNLGPSGAEYDLERPNTLRDEKHLPEEYKTKPEDISKEVDYFIRYYGMKRLLEEMIKSTKVIRFEKHLKQPEGEYMDKLVTDLQVALKNYEERYNEDTEPE